MTGIKGFRKVGRTKFQVYVGFDEDQVGQLQARANARRSTVPQIVREAVDFYFADNTSTIDTSTTDNESRVA